MSVKLLTEHHLEFVSLKGGCTGSSWKSNVAAQFFRADVRTFRTLISQRKGQVPQI